MFGTIGLLLNAVVAAFGNNRPCMKVFADPMSGNAAHNFFCRQFNWIAFVANKITVEIRSSDLSSFPEMYGV